MKKGVPNRHLKQLPHYKRLHSIYSTMKGRCNNPNRPKYHRYGGRGIKVCREWEEDFLNFYNWAVKNGYSDDLTLDREDNDGNYCPENCRWVTNQVNSLNRRTSVKLTVNDVTNNVSIWAEILNISPFTIYDWVRVHGVDYAENRLKEVMCNE